MKNEVNVELNKEKASWLKVVVIDFLVALAIVMAANFLIELDYVDGTSMNPTLQNGNIYVALKVHPSDEYGKIATVYVDSENGRCTKRIIGKGGDTINIKDGVVYRNGLALDEPYTSSPTTPTGDVSFPVTVPEDCYFVLGDNRSMSKDSRFSDFGMIEKENLVGLYLFILPWTK